MREIMELNSSWLVIPTQQNFTSANKNETTFDSYLPLSNSTKSFISGFGYGLDIIPARPRNLDWSATQQEYNDNLMNSFEISLIVLYVFNTVLHAFGFTCLLRINIRSMNPNQKAFLISLCFAELIACFTSAVFFGANGLLNYTGLVAVGYSLNILYYFNMIYITMDRFFEVFLSIKYPVIWPTKNTKYLCLATTTLAISVAITDSLLTEYQIAHSPKNYKQYVYPVMDTLFLGSAIGVYGYIFVKFRQVNRSRTKPQTAKREPYRQSDFSEHLSVTSNKTTKNRNSGKSGKSMKCKSKLLQSRFLIILLLGITFILFVVIPDFMQAVTAGKEPVTKDHIILNYSLMIIKALSYTSDAFIYILLLPGIRRYIKKMIPSNAKSVSRLKFTAKSSMISSTRSTDLSQYSPSAMIRN